MESHLLTGKFNLGAILLSSLMLAACGGSSTTFVEQDRIPVEDDHAHQDGALGGRLLISEAGDAHVHVFDLEHEEIEGDFHLDAPASRLVASPSYRYGLVVQGGDNGQINFVDSGIYFEEHGDHFDLIEAAPSLLDYQLIGDRPAHITQAGGQLAVFFDGNSGAPAQVQVLDEHDLEDNHEPALLEYATNQHGAVQIRGDHLLSTVRAPEANPDSTLPNQVALYHLHDGHYDQEQVFELLCPGLHGSAQNHDFVTFGCSDGVLIIEEDELDHSFSAQKLDYEERISGLYGHDHLEQFVGTGSGNLFLVDPAGEGSIAPLTWTNDENLSPVAYAFVEGGEDFAILDDQGGLTVLHSHDWDASERLQVTHSETAPEGSQFELTVSSDGHFAFVTDPAESEIQVVDMETMEVIDTILLNFTPDKLVWLGVIESEEHEEHGH